MTLAVAWRTMIPTWISFVFKLAGATGFEPAASCVTGRQEVYPTELGAANPLNGAFWSQLGNGPRIAKPLRNMVGTRRLELLTSTVGLSGMRRLHVSQQHRPA